MLINFLLNIVDLKVANTIVANRSVGWREIADEFAFLYEGE